MKIALACDHAAYISKEIVKSYLEGLGHKVSDFGCYSDESCDYPEFAVKAAEAVSSGECERGIVICGSGVGMSIVCNKVKGIRAANCCTAEMANMARRHNDANILNFGARLVNSESAKMMIREFLSTPFDGGRHEIRVKKIHSLTGK